MRAELIDELMELRREIVDRHEPCAGRGWLPPDNPGELNPCECMMTFMYLEALIESQIPRDYWWLNLDDLEVPKEDIAFCRRYLKNIHNAATHALGILFYGPNGIGKTSMQCAIGKEAIVHGYSVQYFTAQQYIEAKQKKNPIVDEYESGDFILFDELDKVYISRGSNYVSKTLEDFLRRMTSSGKVLILCTNGDEEYLSNTFGASTMSVLQRHLGFYPVEGADFSSKLQALWNDLLQSDKDYFAEPILSMARRKAEREIEEDRREWEETY